MWIDAAHGWQDVPVYDGADLRPGCTLPGPLLIEERTTTAFIGPRDTLEVDSRDDFLVTSMRWHSHPWERASPVAHMTPLESRAPQR